MTVQAVQSPALLPNNESNPTYFLSPDVYICRVGDVYIALDVAQDRYFHIPGAALLLAETDVDIAVAIKPHPPRKSEAANVTFREKLVSSGILTEDCSLGKPIELTAHVRVRDGILPVDRRATSPGPLSTAAFFVACSRAASRLKRQPFKKIIDNVQLRKRNARRTADHDSIVNSAARFIALRPYFPRKNVCLYDSLSMIEFLALYGHYPDWVFGVRSSPFSAHCWVQNDGIVLNDDVDRVQLYTQIMVT